MAVGDALRLYRTASGAPGCEMSLAVATIVGVGARGHDLFLPSLMRFSVSSTSLAPRLQGGG